MKKTILLTLLFGIITANCFAQEQDPWVGEWTSEAYTDIDWERSPKDSYGNYESIKHTSFKKILKITKHGDTYIVRSKTIKVNDPSYVSYGLPMTVYSIVGNTMELRSYIEKDPNKENGKVDSYSDYTYYCKITQNNGVLNYCHYRMHIDKYALSMRYIGGEDDFDVSSMPGNKLRLFNDNW